jgi:hypothetical protein
MGRASDPLEQFKRAMRARRFDDAVMLAKGMPLTMDDVVRLTMLAAENKSPRYEPMARRLLTILLEDRQLKISELHWIAERFQDAREGRVREAETALRRFVAV